MGFRAKTEEIIVINNTYSVPRLNLLACLPARECGARAGHGMDGNCWGRNNMQAVHRTTADETLCWAT